MRKRLLIACLTAAMFLCLSPAYAALIGVDLLDTPDILSNSTGSYSYTAADDVFLITATPLTLLEESGLSLITGGTYRAEFKVNSDGSFGGNIGGVTPLLITGTVNGFSGDLLMGEVTAFGYQGIPSTPYAIFDFTFKVTGGLLADAFGGIGVLGGNVTFAEKSNFVDFTANHHSLSKVKSDTAPVVPIPATLWLLGGGLAVLVGIRRRKAN